jgi:hypothetical protein
VPADGTIRAASRAGRILTVMAGDGAIFSARFEDRNAGGKLVLAQDMLFAVVRHHTRDLAGTTSNTLLAVGHNKTIHNDTCFWFNNLILSISTVFTHGGVVRQCSNAQKAKLSPVNLWQINFIQEAVL